MGGSQPQGAEQVGKSGGRMGPDLSQQECRAVGGICTQRAERITADRWLPRHRYATARFSILFAPAAATSCGSGDPLEQSD